MPMPSTQPTAQGVGQGVSIGNPLIIRVGKGEGGDVGGWSAPLLDGVCGGGGAVDAAAVAAAVNNPTGF
jgi:hypothetical protein